MQAPFAITGFEPFGGHETNPSIAVAKAAATALRSLGFDVRDRTLPVTWDEARAFCERAERVGIGTIVFCGLAADRAALSLERGASNVAGEKADNDGVVGSGELVEGGSARLHSKLDLEALRAALAPLLLPEELEVAMSDDAGDYICNAIYYHALSRGLDAVFVHVPEMGPEQSVRAGEALGAAIASLSVRVDVG